MPDLSMKMKLAQLCAACRQREGISQSELARRAGSTQESVNRLESENDTHLPRLDWYVGILGSMGYETRVVVRKRDAGLETTL